MTQPVKINSTSFKINVISIGSFISIMVVGLFDIPKFLIIFWIRES